MPIETPKLTQDAERGGSVGTSGGTVDLDNTTLPSPTNAPAVVKFEGSRLPHLERQFDLMVKGARSLDLGSWEDRFEGMRTDARDGRITAEEIAELIDYDYQTAQDPKSGATTLISALLADATARPVVQMLAGALLDALPYVQRVEATAPTEPARIKRQREAAAMVAKIKLALSKAEPAS